MYEYINCLQHITLKCSRPILKCECENIFNWNLGDNKGDKKKAIIPIKFISMTDCTIFFKVSRLKKELLVCSEERDSSQLERDLLSNRLKHLESELDTEKSSHTDRTREIRSLEVRLDGQRS